MFNPTVTLPSGGYLVINPTEALVSVDVNSGRSTGEYSIERTALNTNLEAADEVARQMRLRDLAGLLVIDFIDMDENRNNRAVEKRLKDALKNDRARIQVGRISPFGLLEMSRQRIRSGVIDSSSNTCQHCQGTGIIRSVESRALHVLRQIGEEITKNAREEINVGLPSDVAVYLLNQKRSAIVELEQAHNIAITISIDTHLMAMEMTINTQLGSSEKPVRMDASTAPSQGERHTKGRRDRRDRNDRNSDKERTDKTELSKSEEETDKPVSDDENTEETRPKRRRRGRRGGRNRRPETNTEPTNETATESSEQLNEAKDNQPPSPVETVAQGQNITTSNPEDGNAPVSEIAENVATTEEAAKPKRRRATKRSSKTSEPEEKSSIASEQADTISETVAADQALTTEKAPKPARRRPKAKALKESAADAGQTEVSQETQSAEQPASGETADIASKPSRRGWWRRG